MGYEQLLSILHTNQEEFLEALDAEQDSPLDCPNDGQPLDEGPDGYPFCKFDGWRPEGAPRIHLH